MAIKLLKLLRQKQPDLIISTHPFGSQMCSYLKRKGKITAKIATIMTDFAPHDQWLVGHETTDYFFVAHTKMKEYLKSKKIQENKIFVTGIPISNRFLQEYNKEQILNDFNLNKNKKTILFFGGGEFGLGKNKTFKIFKDLITNTHNSQIITISGKNEKMKKTFEEITNHANANDHVQILGFSNQIPELMKISDLVITKPGGLTTTECLASNLPMIIINPIPGQEEENAEFLESKGIAIWLKKDNSISQIINDLFSNPNKVNDMKNNTKTLARPNSTKDICNIILNQI
jgi:processive 1,2-diacylglycerol beta-glucosyltransferase